MILGALSPAGLHRLLLLAEPVVLDKQEYISQPDNISRYVYFPESAVISEFQILEDGKTIEIAMIGQEGVTGITSVLDSNAPVNWTQVLISGKAWRISCGSVREMIGSCETLRNNIYKYIDSYIAQISQRIVCGVHHTVEKRLCCWLSMIRDRCVSDHLPLTQEQIARFLGVHRPSVTLITQSLREQGIIDYLRGRISILDRPKLEELSCNCYWVIKDHYNNAGPPA